MNDDKRRFGWVLLLFGKGCYERNSNDGDIHYHRDVTRQNKKKMAGKFNLSLCSSRITGGSQFWVLKMHEDDVHLLLLTNRGMRDKAISST